MDSFQKDIDERANLALSNKFELLLFRLGTSQHDSKSELYGINVFKLREIVPMPKINRAAGMESPLLGMANIRDQIIPVIGMIVVHMMNGQLTQIGIHKLARATPADPREKLQRLFAVTALQPRIVLGNNRHDSGSRQKM